jgi:outer membrane immunogenic protein
MKSIQLLLLAALGAASTIMLGQAVPVAPFGLDGRQVPAIEVSAGYMFVHANAPPGQCGCMHLNGGYGSLVINMPRGFSLVADLSAAHAGQVGGTAQNITVFNDLFGPRYSFRTASRRFTPYVQALGGQSQETSNYVFIGGTASAAAFSAGGGLNSAFSRHIGWNIVEADWVHSSLPNAVNSSQNDLRISSGIFFRFGPR